MARPPVRPRTIGRAAEADTPRVAGRELAAGLPRSGVTGEPELFDLPFVEPMKLKLAERLPAGERWQYEIKQDGYRGQVHRTASGVRILTKRGTDLARKLPAIVTAIEALDVRSIILDGEIVVVDENGIADFFALHGRIGSRVVPDATFYAFDLLHLDGQDLRPKPLAERQAILAELMVGAHPALHLSEHHVGEGATLLKAACEMGLEGIVAKRRDAPYRSGERPEWIKVRCTTVEAFAAVGFDPRGRTGVRALKLARLVGNQLVLCGYVGSGIGEVASRALRKALDAGEAVVVNVEHRGHTPAGELRHPVFKGQHPEG